MIVTKQHNRRTGWDVKNWIPSLEAIGGNPPTIIFDLVWDESQVRLGFDIPKSRTIISEAYPEV